MKRAALLGGLAVSLISGCAPNTDNIQSEYVSPETYANYDCQQIGAEFGRLSQQAEELGAVVDKQAEDDQAQAVVGLVLFWPALFFLEGSETQQTMEYSRLKGEMEALEKVSVEKGCGVDIQHLAESASTGAVVAANPQKLEALKVLYRDGAITEEEYLKRRKEITEAQAKRELAALEREKAAAAAAATPQEGVAALKVAIFYTLGGGLGGDYPGAEGEQNIIGSAEGYIRRHNRLELKYSYFSDNFDVVEPGTKLWSGKNERRPLKNNVYRTGGQIGADVVLMHYIRTYNFFEVEVFLFDIKNKREYYSKGNKRNYKQETERLFEKLIASQK